MARMEKTQIMRFEALGVRGNAGKIRHTCESLFSFSILQPLHLTVFTALSALQILGRDKSTF